MRFSLRICRSWNEPVLERSAGMTAVLSQPPLTYSKKLSPGFTLLSIPVRSTPQVPSVAFGMGGGAGGGVVAANVQPATTRPISAKTLLRMMSSVMR